MKTFTKLMAATAVALTMGATASQAAIFVSFDGVTDAVPGGLTPSAFGEFGADLGPNGGFEAINISGNTGFLPVVLSTNTVEINNAGGGTAATTIYITQTGLTVPFRSFLTTFSGNSAQGYTGSIKSYVSTADAKFVGTEIGAFTLPACGAAICSIAGSSTSSSFALPDAPYSVTHVYSLSTNRLGTSRPSAFTAAVIPEPGTWALMIGGFAGAGAMLRSRRRSNVATA